MMTANTTRSQIRSAGVCVARHVTLNLLRRATQHVNGVNRPGEHGQDGEHAENNRSHMRCREPVRMRPWVCWELSAVFDHSGLGPAPVAVRMNLPIHPCRETCHEGEDDAANEPK